jgi:Fe2+ or Zn2+ uptake regulation protein
MKQRPELSPATKLANAGVRPTTARVAILESLEEVRDHPTADELTVRLGRSGHRIGRATVYQNLDKLLEAGVIASLTAGDGLRRYDATLEPHQHFIDSESGRIYDVHVDEALLKKLKPIDPTTGKALKNAKVGEVRIQFHGSRSRG